MSGCDWLCMDVGVGMAVGVGMCMSVGARYQCGQGQERKQVVDQGKASWSEAEKVVESKTAVAGTAVAGNNRRNSSGNK